MSPQFLVLPKALADMEEAAGWYGSKSAGLRTAYLSDLDDVLERIQAYPSSAPIYRGAIRRALFGKFPYGVFYVASAEVIKVLAVFHLKQYEAVRGRAGLK